MTRPRLASLRGPLLAAGLALLGACGGDGALSVEAGLPSLPVIDGPHSPAWTPRPTSDDPAVATVNGVPILGSQLRAALAEETGGASPAPAALLERLIELELLAQTALADGYWRPEVVLEPYESALVREILAERFHRKPPESYFDDAFLREMYYQPSIRVKFDHVDAFRVADAQYVCCPKRFDECDAAAVEACIKESEPIAREVYEDIRSMERPDIQTFSARVRAWEDQYPKLNVNTYSFFYNVNLPHEEQRGYNVVNENVARAAMGIEVGQFAAPVASRNGWHILYLISHAPEEHRTIDDPEVRQELVRELLPARQKAEYDAWMKALRQMYGVEVDEAALRVFLKALTGSAGEGGEAAAP